MGLALLQSIRGVYKKILPVFHGTPIYNLLDLPLTAVLIMLVKEEVLLETYRRFDTVDI
jgi:hypothetical protein